MDWRRAGGAESGSPCSSWQAAAAAFFIAAGGMMAGGGLFPWIWLALAAYGVLAAASLLPPSAGKADAAGRRVLELRRPGAG